MSTLDAAPVQDERAQEILSDDALAFLAELHERFNPRRLELLQARKAANLLATGADAVAAANPGCALQIAAYLDGRDLPIYHPMTLLDHSIRGSRP